MKIQLLTIGIIILFVVGLSGCNEENNTLNTEKNRFIGTWQNTTMGFTTTITLFSDSTCKINTGNGTWDLKDGKLVITLALTGQPTEFPYTFSNNDRTLTLTPSNNVPMIYSKQ